MHNNNNKKNTEYGYLEKILFFQNYKKNLKN